MASEKSKHIKLNKRQHKQKQQVFNKNLQVFLDRFKNIAFKKYYFYVCISAYIYKYAGLSSHFKFCVYHVSSI